ncbi:DUF2868 domain-containing protein [Atopomonas sediminilitoris]|uniref:DUF2868 domain-containing protein n=1 Tax=Atopomonas sediminilitoris TaxID=2919919 RepID=UPI001F4EC50F|nr:DUF2868 domain-containing protein [Atopomonas sediminilitoris]MCJ8169610.1 DUF2868 domain-containing protein [Atopomonas sediminilitoris]
MSSPHHTSTFDRLWLAESLRLLEEQQGPLDDQAVLAHLQQQGNHRPKDLILQRAAAEGARLKLDHAQQRWRLLQRLGSPLLALLALLSGGLLSASLLGDGSQPVNIFVVLLGLGGLASLTLVLWLGGMLLRQSSSVLGRLWLDVQRLSLGDGNAAWLARGYAALLSRGHLLRWQLGLISHSFWLLHLTGALLGLVLLLSVRRYGFIWESTLLPAESFITLTQPIGMAAALLNLPQPDLGQIAASDQWQRHDAALQQAWAGWLLAALLLYVWLPRLIGVIVCALHYQRRQRRLDIDLSLPGYATLANRLQHRSLGVLDAEHPHTSTRATHAAPSAGSGQWLVGLELADDEPWPLSHAEGWRDGGVLRQRQHSAALLQGWQAQPPQHLLLVCDARQTPDRGLERWLESLANAAAQPALLLLHAEHSPRLALWQQLNWPHPRFEHWAQAHAWTQSA